MISLILPAYNPGSAVEQTWLAVEHFLAERAAHADPWEALFVLDGCTDDTADRLARLAATGGPRARVLSYPTNRGKGYALRTGLLAARGRFRVFTDVDLAYSFDDVLRVAAALRAGAAVAIASREHPESRVNVPTTLLAYAGGRQRQSRVFGAVARFLLPITQRDTQAGLKGMTAAVAAALIPELRCDGFGFDCELLTACARSGVPVTELPVCVRYDTSASTTGLRASLRMLRELFRIRRAWRGRAIAVPLPSEPLVVPGSDRPAAAA